MTGPGVRSRTHAEDHPEPLPPDEWEVRRLRCEGCGRPLRVGGDGGVAISNHEVAE
jgi:hypothetical protein